MRPPSGAAGVTGSLAARAAAGLIVLCAFFLAAAAAIGLVGIAGVRSATRTGEHITADEIATATATARAGQAIDAAFVAGQLIALTSSPERAGQLQSLLTTTLPAADTAVAKVLALHDDDGAEEKDDAGVFAAQWAGLRASLIRVTTNPPVASTAALSDLRSSFSPLSSHLAKLTDREDIDAIVDQRAASATMRSTTWTVLFTVAGTALAAMGAAWFAIRRVRLALRPEQDQSEFADTMQLADGETEAHQLIKQHLERAVPRSTVTILNRNNSADRLEAVTAIGPESCLARTLEHAEPRSCLAVRSGRPQRQNGGQPALMRCAVCGECPGSSICTPLTVGGEVIGSVLANAPGPPTPEQEGRVRDSVIQAAPILANLRNLAIAEVRASTDALTGLPNKRAVDDNLKRMLAQASRTLTPMAVLSIDLDHFKQINDRHGHPAGDQALANVGAALSSVLRESDFAGRNGGEEFSVLLPDTELDGAHRTAEKIRAAISEIRISTGEAMLTASIGVAIYPTHATSAEQLERLADAALYVAKRSGRNRVELANTENLTPGPAHERSPDMTPAG